MVRVIANRIEFWTAKVVIKTNNPQQRGQAPAGNNPLVINNGINDIDDSTLPF